MTIIVADFETFYDGKRPKGQKYSLRHMGTEEYILHKEFQVHGVAISVDGSQSEWMDHKNAVRFFAGIEWERTLFVAHNAMFDGAILVWRYGFMPKMFACTLGIANAFIRPHTGLSGLDECAKYLGLPLKDATLKEMEGKRTEEILRYQGLWEAAGAYACQDNENCKYIFHKYYPQMLTVEKKKLSWSVKNYVRGRLRLNLTKLHQAYVEGIAERDELLRDAGIDKATANSTRKFAAYLEELGIEVEYKDGKGKKEIEVPALARNDAFVRELLAHEDPRIRAMIKARLACSSNNETSRAARLMRCGNATRGRMLLPTYYYGAHTGRPGGADAINITNFRKHSPDDPKNKILVRDAIEAPTGKALVEVDASQIEARFCAFLASCDHLLDAFADPERDPYCEYAGEVFGRKITKEDKKERQVGKVAVLSMQYGVGAEKTMKTLAAQGIMIDLDEAQRRVDVYRAMYPEILINGAEFKQVWTMAISDNVELTWKGFVLAPWGWQLPSGRRMFYDDLSIHGRELKYWSPRYKNWQKLYPGSINENACQSMTNDHVGAVLADYHEDTVAMTYDSVTRLIAAGQIEEEADATVAMMSMAPEWTKKIRDDRPLVLDAEKHVKVSW